MMRGELIDHDSGEPHVYAVGANASILDHGIRTMLKDGHQTKGLSELWWFDLQKKRANNDKKTEDQWGPA
jgi:hypothetical protein